MKKLSVIPVVLFHKKAFDLATKIKEFTGEEITRAYIDIKENQVADNTLIIYELKNRVQAEQIFLEEIGSGSEIVFFEPDDQTKIPVYKTSFNGLINTFYLVSPEDLMKPILHFMIIL